MTLGTPNSLVIGGRYRLEREIGRGGMGVVWLGHDELLDRSVALKRIAVGASDREARIAARLHHPNVVAVFDLVDDPAEGRWLVMECVEGSTLAGLVGRDGALAPEVASGYLAQVASALAAAKAAGITHRDVKPSNVLVDADGVAKLSDFGIARATTDETATQTEMLMGSPAYVAPEVATGEGAGHTADVWSLGATAYFLVAGEAPYASADPDAADTPLSTLYRIVHDEPPSTEHAGSLAPLIEHTMVKDPARRWSVEQVQAFLQDGVVAPIDATQAIAPVTAGPVDEKRRRRPNALVLAVLGVLVVIVAALGYAALSNSGGEPPASAKSGSGATAAGMKAFIRTYVRTVGDNPDAAWTMLTPRFQRASGGFAKYHAFWDAATNGRVLSIQANPDDLMVSYQVHFDDFDNGPGPTVLQLVYKDGRYLIDAESSKGFTPVH